MPRRTHPPLSAAPREGLLARYDEEVRRRIFTASPDGILVGDERHRLVDANPAACAMLGRTLDEVRALRVTDIHPPADLPWILDLFARQFQDPGVSGKDVPVLRKDGSIRHADISTVALEVAGRRYLVGVFRDVTERRKSAEALRESEARHRRLIEGLQKDYFFYRHGPDGVFTYVSPSVREMLGYTPEEFLRHYTEVLVDDADRAEVVRRTDLALRGERQPAYPVHVRHRDGTARWLEVAETPVLGSDGRVAAVEGLAHDVTGARLAAAELEANREMFHESQKLEALGRLAGGVAHDFNNLMTVVLGTASDLLEHLPEKSPLRQRLQAVEDAARHASDLTQQLLSVGRKQMLEPTLVDLNAVVRGCARLLRSSLGDPRTLEFRLSEEECLVRADRVRLQQVLLNLVGNSRDAMPDGGVAVLETGRETLDATRRAGAGTVPPGDYCVLRLVDEGAGMDEATLARATEPFFTTKTGGRGTGLGLASAAGIVAQSGGTLTLDSAPGKGTKAVVYLPRRKESRAGSRPAARPQPEAAVSGGPKILLVEDDASVRSLLAHVLRKAGYRVEEYGGGSQALERAGRAGPADALVTDVVMAGMNGLFLAKRLHERFPRLKVLFISGHARDVFGEEGASRPWSAYLAKPFAPPDLLRKLAALLKKG